MDRIKVELLQHSPLGIVVEAARTCYKSEGDNGGDKDIALIKKLLKLGHLSVFEHCYFTFRIKGISRGCLQQLVRHRIASYSVQSTRYTLKKLLAEADSFVPRYYHWNKINWEEVGKYIVLTGDKRIDEMNARILEDLRQDIEFHKNDVLKYHLPEAFRTELIWTINARSLRNFLQLRLSKKAHFEIRHLANLILEKVLENHSILFEDLIERVI